MQILKWVGLFIVLWIIGTLAAAIVEIALAALGFPLSVYGSGLIIMLFITSGLIIYGTKRKEKHGK